MKRNKLDIDFKNYDDERTDRIARSKERKLVRMERRKQRRRTIADKHGACDYNETQEVRREYGR
jgi:hypothetical protein